MATPLRGLGGLWSPLSQPNPWQPWKPLCRAAASSGWRLWWAQPWALLPPQAWPADTASGLSLLPQPTSAYLWWRGLGMSPYTGRWQPRLPSLAGKESRRAPSGAVTVGALWPKTCTCPQGTAPPLWQPSPCTLCPSASASSTGSLPSQCRLFPPLALSSAVALGPFQGVAGCGGTRLGGVQPRTYQRVLHEFFFSLLC